MRAVERLPSRAVETIKTLPREVVNTAKTFPAKVAREVKNLPVKTLKAAELLVTKPDDALKPVGELIQAGTRPFLKPLEKPAGKVWKPLTEAGAAVASAVTWVAGAVVISTYGGVMYAAGNKDEARRADDSAKQWNTFVRDKMIRRSAESLQTLNQFRADMKKIGSYTIGIAGLDEIKAKIAELEREAYKLLALKREEALAQLDTPEARRAILVTLATLLRESPHGLAAMEARARYMRALIYNQNALLHPDQIVPEPTFSEALAEGWRALTRTDQPVQTYRGVVEPVEPPAAVAGLASGDMLAGMNVVPLIRDRDALVKQRASLVIAWEQGWADARSLPAGAQHDLAVAKMEQRQPVYERQVQQLEARITALNDQIQAAQRENAAAVGAYASKLGGNAKNLVVAAANTAVNAYAYLDNDMKAKAAERDVAAAAAELRAAQDAKTASAAASRTNLVLFGVAALAAVLVLKNRK